MKLLIQHGRVIDPATGRDEIADILVQDGVIEQVGKNISSQDAEIIDAT